MQIFAQKEDCTGCTACQLVCPPKCISMAADEKGFLYPRIDEAACTGCGLCVKVCESAKKRSVRLQYLPVPEIYAVKHRSDAVRYLSSSGGAFTAISDWFLNNNGVVYGAAFDENLEVRHIRCDTAAARDRLRGSKYVQSDLGRIFLLVEEDLRAGRKVLFSGTPCQIAGLYAYLRGHYPDLYTCDLICHGVPSPGVFEGYLRAISRKYNAKVIELNFRDKVNGWKNYTFTASFQNYKKSCPIAEDSYGYLFLKDLILRPSCYSCAFANTRRCADITIGDFWGIEKSHQDFFDNKGVSVMLVSTPKGRGLLSQIEQDMILEKSDVVRCMQWNLSAPTRPSPLVTIFWRDYSARGYEYVARKYTLENPFKRCRFMIHKSLSGTRLYSYLKRIKRAVDGSK